MATNFASAKLRSFLERVERLNEEKRALGADISEVFKEAKGEGFDTAVMRRVLKLRALTASEREEARTMEDLSLGAGAVAEQPRQLAQAAE